VHNWVPQLTHVLRGECLDIKERKKEEYGENGRMRSLIIFTCHRIHIRRTIKSMALRWAKYHACEG